MILAKNDKIISEENCIVKNVHSYFVGLVVGLNIKCCEISNNDAIVNAIKTLKTIPAFLKWNNLVFLASFPLKV